MRGPLTAYCLPLTLFVPALRDRPNDLPTLLASEIARASRRQGTSIVGLDRDAADRLLAYSWPGNLRELSKVIRAAVALTTGSVISVEHLPLGGDAGAAAAGPAGGASLPDRSLRQAVHRHITAVLESVGGNKRRAARELGVSRATLERKLQEISKLGRKST